MKKQKCSHCQQEFDQNLIHQVNIGNEKLYFCCNGCTLAYTLLKENNLESFYEKINDKKLNTREISQKENLMNYDSINFKEKYLVDLGNHQKEVNFYIDGIICAACIWLNENIISQIEGVDDIKINYTTHKAKLIFNENTVCFSQIAKKIFAIGYNITVFSQHDLKYTKESKSSYTKFVVAIFCSMNVMWVNVGQYVGFFNGIDDIYKNILNLASFILATPVLFFCASDFYKSAYKGIKNKIIGMDLLVISGTTIVYFYSIFAWLVSKNETYFESVCMIITFVLAAKTIENIVKKSTDNNLERLNSILPLEARLKNGEIISVNDITENTELLVLPGEMLCCDGVLKSEFCTLDYSNINGESLEVSKKLNESIQAGSICLNQSLIYQTSTNFKDSSISKLARLLRDSSFSTPKIAKLAFKVSSVFSRVVLSIAFLGFLAYIFSGASFHYALLIGVSVIIIACPCALALATPIAGIVGLNKAFKNHIIFTRADFLETLNNVDTVVFDKTGTLTKGTLRVSSIEKRDSFISFAILKEINKLNPHKISTALNQYLESKYLKSEIKQEQQNNKDTIINGIDAEILNISDKEIKDFILSNFTLIAGLGFRVDADINNKTYEIMGGSLELFKQEGGIEPISHTNYEQLRGNVLHQENEKCRDKIIFILGYREKDGKNIDNQQYLESKNFKISYIFYLQDSVKEHAYNLIKYLQSLKKDVILLSGDREGVVKGTASILGIKKYYAGVKPISKAEFIKNLIENKKIVAMIGDGLNDSLALDYAHIGIVMGSGSEISIAKSNIIILDDKLSTLELAFKISRSTLKSIKQNLAISIIYNILAIPFALSGLIIPLFAALFMSLSSLCVVLNSIRGNIKY